MVGLGLGNRPRLFIMRRSVRRCNIRFGMHGRLRSLRRISVEIGNRARRLRRGRRSELIGNRSGKPVLRTAPPATASTSATPGPPLTALRLIGTHLAWLFFRFILVGIAFIGAGDFGRLLRRCVRKSALFAGEGAVARLATAASTPAPPPPASRALGASF